MDYIQRGIYQHYKGPFYLVLGEAVLEPTTRATSFVGLAHHSETGLQYEIWIGESGHLIIKEGLPALQGMHVIYAPLYPHKGAGLSIRPLNMFEEMVEVDGGPYFAQLSVPRFNYCGPVFPPPGLPRPSDVTTEGVIGRLDRVLSEFLILCERPDLDEADFQALKHHGDDLIGVGVKAQGILFDRKRRLGRQELLNQTEMGRQKLGGESVECIFTKDGDFVALSDANVRESTETDHYHVKSISRAEYDEAVEGRLRVYADGRMERPHR